MEEITKNITLNHFVLVVILIILGLWLKRFIPPIKEQYQSIIIFIVGGLLGHLLIDNALFGICISGLVFYKDVLVNECLEIIECAKILKDKELKEKEEKEKKENGDDLNE